MKFLLLKLAEQWKQPGLLGHPPNVASIYPPLGLEYLGASLEQHGHDVEIIDFGAETISEEHLKQRLMTSDAVGMSVYTNNYQHAAVTTRIIKELDPQIPMIIGGPHCTFLKQRSLADLPCADIAVALEGETVIVDVARYLEGKKQLSDIPGIYYREKNEIQTGKPLHIVEDLDTLPFPARHLTTKYDYGNFPWGYTIRKKFTSMITSRGCPFRCRFCARYSNVVPGYGFRMRSVDNVVDELREIHGNYGSVVIVDDNFLADRKRAHRIFDRLLDIGTDFDLILLGARVDSAERSLYVKMKKAGVTYVSFGVESGNQDVLDFYKKNITLDQIRTAIQLGRDMDFFIDASFIFGAPQETKEHLMNSIKFITSLPLDTVVIRPLNYDMGTELWSEAVTQGKIAADEFLVLSDSRRDLGNFTIEELNDYIKKAFRRFYLRPRYLFGQLYRAFKHHDMTRLKQGLQVLTSPQLRNIL